jgi:hypothetical protein
VLLFWNDEVLINLAGCFLAVTGVLFILPPPKFPSQRGRDLHLRLFNVVN